MKTQHYQVLYSCKIKKQGNPEQLKLVRGLCENKEECKVDVSREVFGGFECPGTKSEDMSLWLVYTCDADGKDVTDVHSPSCGGKCDQDNPGNKTQLDVRGCGGKIDLVCEGGCINVHKVLTMSRTLLWILSLAECILHLVPLVSPCYMTPQLNYLIV